MTNERKRIYYVIIGVLSLSILGLSLGYAALSTTLKTTFGSVTQSAASWNVGFETGNVNATAGGTSATGRTCGAATVTNNTVSVANTTLSKPGDSCTYALTVKNTGSIAANLSSITATQPSGTTCDVATVGRMICGNITYKLTTDAAGATLLTTNKKIAASTGTLPIYLVVTYTGSSLATTEASQVNASFTLIYNQA